MHSCKHGVDLVAPQMSTWGDAAQKQPWQYIFRAWLSQGCFVEVPVGRDSGMVVLQWALKILESCSDSSRQASLNYDPGTVNE